MHSRIILCCYIKSFNVFFFFFRDFCILWDVLLNLKIEDPLVDGFCLYLLSSLSSSLLDSSCLVSCTDSFLNELADSVPPILETSSLKRVKTNFSIIIYTTFFLNAYIIHSYVNPLIHKLLYIPYTIWRYFRFHLHLCFQRDHSIARIKYRLERFNKVTCDWRNEVDLK